MDFLLQHFSNQLQFTVNRIVDLKPVDVVRKGQHVSFKVPDKVRPSDKLYKLVSPEDLKKK